MNDNRKLDELLNAYMDGQLTERHRTEVKRLLYNDPQMAQRLTALQKVRALVAALPTVHAPDQIVHQVREKLERRSITPSDTADFDRDAGARQLLWRRAISVAAIVALAVVLAAVIFTIVGPESPQKTHIVSENWMTDQIPMPESVGKKAALSGRTDQPPAAPAPLGSLTAAQDHQPAPPQNFTGRLELTTAMFSGVDAFVKRSLLDNGIVLIELPVSETQTGVYNLRCSRTALGSFMDDLATIWDKLDSATLAVATDKPDHNIIVENATAKQIIEIVTQTDMAKSIELAQNAAAMNALTRDLPQTTLAAKTDVESLPIPKPVMTSSEISPKSPAAPQPGEMINLAIQITSPQ